MTLIETIRRIAVSVVLQSLISAALLTHTTGQAWASPYPDAESEEELKPEDPAETIDTVSEDSAASGSPNPEVDLTTKAPEKPAEIDSAAITPPGGTRLYAAENNKRKEVNFWIVESILSLSAVGFFIGIIAAQSNNTALFAIPATLPAGAIAYAVAGYRYMNTEGMCYASTSIVSALPMGLGIAFLFG